MLTISRPRDGWVMTLSGTWCDGSEVRFMSAVESVANRLTKTTLQSFRCDGLFKSNIHNRVGRAVRAFEFGTTARCKIRIALRHNSAAAAASFLCPGARRSSAIGQRFAGRDRQIAGSG
jgi:hypothetical protein